MFKESDLDKFETFGKELEAAAYKIFKELWEIKGIDRLRDYRDLEVVRIDGGDVTAYFENWDYKLCDETFPTYYLTDDNWKEEVRAEVKLEADKKLACQLAVDKKNFAYTIYEHYFG